MLEELDTPTSKIPVTVAATSTIHNGTGPTLTNGAAPQKAIRSKEILPAKQSAPDRNMPQLKPREAAQVREFQEHCRQFHLSLFYAETDPVQSLGITSALHGEGKTFLSIATARVLANDMHDPVILIDSNWERPSLHEHFHLPATPGLAEWVRGECSEMEIRHRISHNLTVIPAGQGRNDAVKLLRLMQQKGLRDTLVQQDEKVIIDLPPVIATAYGSIAARLVESVIVVVQARVTPDRLVAETCERLKDLPVRGIVLNKIESRIPGWLRQVL